jgi:hypothetical protein
VIFTPPPSRPFLLDDAYGLMAHETTPSRKGSHDLTPRFWLVVQGRAAVQAATLSGASARVGAAAVGAGAADRRVTWWS